MKRLTILPILFALITTSRGLASTPSAIMCANLFGETTGEISLASLNRGHIHQVKAMRRSLHEVVATLSLYPNTGREAGLKLANFAMQTAQRNALTFYRLIYVVLSSE